MFFKSRGGRHSISSWWENDTSGSLCLSQQAIQNRKNLFSAQSVLELALMGTGASSSVLQEQGYGNKRNRALTSCQSHWKSSALHMYSGPPSDAEQCVAASCSFSPESESGAKYWQPGSLWIKHSHLACGSRWPGLLISKYESASLPLSCGLAPLSKNKETDKNYSFRLT